MITLSSYALAPAIPVISTFVQTSLAEPVCAIALDGTPFEPPLKRPTAPAISACTPSGAPTCLVSPPMLAGGRTSEHATACHRIWVKSHLPIIHNIAVISKGVACFCTIHNRITLAKRWLCRSVCRRFYRDPRERRDMRRVPCYGQPLCAFPIRSTLRTPRNFCSKSGHHIGIGSMCKRAMADV
jgi:hypothetical protein